MRKLSLWTGAVCVLVGLALSVRADEDDQASRAIVIRAIKAQGGEKRLKKATAAQIKSTGTLDFMNGVKFTSEIFTQDPDKFKNVIEVNINNMNLAITQVYNGKSFWMKVMDQDIEFKDAKDLAEMKENMYLERLANLIGLTEKGITLSPLGEAKVNDQDAVGVRASSKGHRDLNLYFAKKTGMLVKYEARVYDIQSKQEVTQEKIMSDYKASDGIMTPWKIVVNQNGKRYLTVDVSAVTYTDRHDDSMFAKP